jgi:hypothetical protein
MSSRKRRRPEGAVEGEEDGPIELSSTSGTSHASQPSSSLSNTLSSPHKKRLLHGTSDSDANMQHQTSQGAHVRSRALFFPPCPHQRAHHALYDFL